MVVSPAPVLPHGQKNYFSPKFVRFVFSFFAAGGNVPFERCAQLKCPRDMVKVLDIDWVASDKPVLATADGCLRVMDLDLTTASSTLLDYEFTGMNNLTRSSHLRIEPGTYRSLTKLPTTETPEACRARILLLEVFGIFKDRHTNIGSHRAYMVWSPTYLPRRCGFESRYRSTIFPTLT